MSGAGQLRLVPAMLAAAQHCPQEYLQVSQQGGLGECTSIMVAPGTLTMPLASFLISSLGTRTWVPKLPAWRPLGTLGCGGSSRSARSSWYSSSMKQATLNVYFPLSLQRSNVRSCHSCSHSTLR